VQTVIIGGGIIGVASAYYLQEKGNDVTLLEKSKLGTGSTGRANGGIRAQFSSPVSAKLSLESIKVWEAFDEQFDTDIGYRRPGYMFLAREASTAEQFRENVRKQNEFGIPSEFVDPTRAQELCPELHADKFVGGAYCPTDGFADPNLALQGFAAAARESGVEIRTGTEVTDILVGWDGQVTGVETDAGSFNVEFVVNAAGAWGGEVGEMAGIDLPISPKRRQLAVFDPEIAVPDSVPFTIDADNGIHFRPEREGNVVAGGHFDPADPAMDPDSYPTRVPLDWSAQVAEGLADVADYFGLNTEIRNGWSGLYAVTPDHHPIIEETVPGFVNAVGFSGHGFMQSPATGQLVAELVTDGEASLVDISELSLNRFEGGSPLEEGTVID